MRRREFYWSLYHAPEKNQVDSLRTDQVEAVFACIPERAQDEWLIWREGFQKWKPFSHFPQLLTSLRKVDPKGVEPIPAPPTALEMAGSADEDDDKVDAEGTKVGEKPKDSGGAAADSSAPSAAAKKANPELLPESYDNKKVVDDDDEPLTSELSLVRIGVDEIRGNNRFDKVVEVRIVAGEKSYPNHTVNISLKGIQFRAPLPEGLPRYFNVEIRYQNKVIPLVCAEVKNKDGSPSNRARIEVNDYASALLGFLLNG